MENQNKNVIISHYNGIVRIDSVPKLPEEIEKTLQELEDRRFDPFVTVSGRMGNIIMPMEQD